MLECKYYSSHRGLGRIYELIDTCWNVNIAESLLELYKDKELIDTCWNVNQNFVTSQRILQRINRYMLECKLHRLQLHTLHGDRINRYMLECK